MNQKMIIKKNNRAKNTENKIQSSKMSEKKQLIQKLEIKIKYNWAKIGRIIWLKNKKSNLKKTTPQKLQKNIHQHLLFCVFSSVFRF